MINKMSVTSEDNKKIFINIIILKFNMYNMNYIYINFTRKWI